MKYNKVKNRECKGLVNINRSLKDPADVIWIRVNEIINKYGLKFIQGTFKVNINILDKCLTRYCRAIRLRHLSKKWPKRDSDPAYWVKNPTFDIALAEKSAYTDEDPIQHPALLISFLDQCKQSILNLALQHNNTSIDKSPERFPDLDST